MSDFFDYQALVPTIGNGGSALRMRVGVVQSIQADRTCTVTVGGSTTAITGVKYLAHVQPVPSKAVWIVSDGPDLFILGVIAGNDRTLAPRANRSTDQSIPDATDTAISFDGVQSDLWGTWSAGNAARLTAKITGRYLAIGQVQFAANGTGFRAAWLERTGTATVGRVQVISAASGSPTYIVVTSAPFDMTADSDYVRLIVRQNSGGALAASSASTYFPSLSLIYLGP